MRGVNSHLLSPIRLHGVMLNKLSTGTTVPATQKEPACISCYHLFTLPIIIPSFEPVYLALYSDGFRAGRPALDSRQG
jgi:hypothetical protein